MSSLCRTIRRSIDRQAGAIGAMKLRKVARKLPVEQRAKTRFSIARLKRSGLFRRLRPKQEKGDAK
jgi:hypothetical protein